MNWASGQCANHLGRDACTEAVSERSRNGLGTVSETGPLARPREGFARFELRGRCSTFARSSIDFVAGAALSPGRVQISWQAQHFRKVKYRFRGRRSTFARSSTEFVAGASLSQGQVQNLWQVQHFRKVKCKIRGTRSTFARSSTDFVAGAALSQGQAQIWWQAQHFCKVNFRSRGSKIATFKYESSTRSQLSQLGLENRNF